MARANRHHLPGYIWHITHRCHKKEFLLKFNKDKDRWIHWLFETKKRFGLVILNYTVTSNHIHLLVCEGKNNSISKSIQLIAGRTGREYNQRKRRQGAFWADRYHATAVKSGHHLIQCLAYIDTNMVRAGVVTHPSEWMYGGYREIQKPKRRYSLINRDKLAELVGVQDSQQLSEYHRHWVEAVLNKSSNRRSPKWTESIAVGDEEFVAETKAKLGTKAVGRKAQQNNDGYELRDPQRPYSLVLDAKNGILRENNEYFWNVSD
jgi:REP element-mobilizing transposase RayT